MILKKYAKKCDASNMRLGDYSCESLSDVKAGIKMAKVVVLQG